MMRSESDSFKQGKNMIKMLFNFNGDEGQLETFCQEFINYIKDSQNDIFYFIDLLKHYSFCRPNHHYVSEKLVNSIVSCFPTRIEERVIFSLMSYFEMNT